MEANQMKKIDLALIENANNPSNLTPVVKKNFSVTSNTKLSPALQHIISEVQKECIYFEENLTESELKKIIVNTSERLGFELSAFELDQIISQIEKEKRPFGVLQDLIDDPEISDVIVSGYSKIVIQKARQNFITSHSFSSQEVYEAFVEKLLSKAGTTYSTKQPIADGMLGSFARIHAVHKSISEDGPYLTIRLNRYSNVTLEELEKSELAPRLIFDYLGSLVGTGQTLLVLGEVATGKTTLVRALAATIPTEESILVIEDTPEIQLEHPNVRYIRTREANVDGAGKISPSECIRGGMRMAMNRIVFGEMRDSEAAESFIDVCASGHPGMSTMHARSSLEAIVRLKLFLGRIQKGVDKSVLEQQIGTAVQVLIHLDICKETRKRRIMKVTEIGSLGNGQITYNDVFEYTCINLKPAWKLKSKVSLFREKLRSQNKYVDLANLPEELTC